MEQERAQEPGSRKEQERERVRECLCEEQQARKKGDTRRKVEEEERRKKRREKQET